MLSLRDAWFGIAGRLVKVFAAMLCTVPNNWRWSFRAQRAWLEPACLSLSEHKGWVLAIKPRW